MPQDAFHIRRLAAELDAFLQGGKINRVSQVDKDELTFIIYTGKTTVKLILSTNASNARVCLSLTEKEPAPVAPNFCMLLRKHLQGAEILSVKQYAFERIIEITLHCKADFSECDRVLRCELMGKYSNIVLTENGVILGALKTTSLDCNYRRVLFSGAKYAYPEPQDKADPLNVAQTTELFTAYFAFRSVENGLDENELGSYIFENVAGFAPTTAREFAKIYLAKTTNGGNGGENGVTNGERVSGENLAVFLKDFCENYPCNPCVTVGKDGAYTDFFAFPVAGGKEMPSLCKAEDEFFTGKETRKGFADKKRKLESAARGLKKKIAKKMQDTFDRLQEAEKADDNKIKGELITANLYRLEKGMKSFEAENWYVEPYEKTTIALDETLSPSQNAQRYFKAYNKQKRAREVLLPRLKDEEAEAAYADSILSSIAAAETVDDLKEIETELVDLGLIKKQKERVGGKKKEEVPFREYEYLGFKIYAGRNNVQNDRLLRAASPLDTWLHTQKYHSSHVIIASGGQKIPDEVLLRAAEICAYYSDGRNGDKIPVDYCLKKYVKKPNKAKAGFVIYTDYKTVLVSPKA